MYNPLDPVDRAFEALKSERWGRDKSRLELENRLMQEYRTSGRPSRFTKYRALLIAGAVVLVGGAGFAATDTGSSAIKRFLVFVNIDGEESELSMELLEGGDATWTMENEDGSETTIHLSHSPEADGALGAGLADVGGSGVVTVDVDVVGNETGDQNIEIAVGGHPADGTIAIDASGNPAKLDELMNQVDDGQSKQAVKVIEVKGDGAADHRQRMVRINGLLDDEVEGATDVQVEVGDDGVATLHLTYPDGTKAVRKVDLGDQEGGEITVTVDEDGEATARAAKIER